MRKDSFLLCAVRRSRAGIIGLWCGLLLLGAAPAPEAPSGVLLQAGKLSVHVEGVPLRQVVAEVSRLNHTPIVWLSGEGQEDPVSLEFADVPLLEGIERILQRHNFIVVYEPHPRGTQLKQIWIASLRKATQPPPPPAEEKKSLSVQAREQTTGAPQERATAAGREGVVQKAVVEASPRQE